MKFEIQHNIRLKNNNGREFLADFYEPVSEKVAPLIIFVHGYKGFKDWGAWNLMAEKFAKAGFNVVLFNFSLNGIGLENTSEFTDIDAFSENTYSQELVDLQTVIRYFSEKINKKYSEIILLGHSRGGGISVLTAERDRRISSLITLGSVSSLDRFVTGEQLEEWKRTGIYFTYNSRTKQQMPHKIDFYNDFQLHKGKLDVQGAAKNIKIPTLIIHGENDESVDASHAKHLHSWIANSKLIIVPNTGHTFNTKEPWTDFKLPVAMNTVVKTCLKFLENVV